MFAKDSRTEQVLERMGVTWKYTNALVFNDLFKGWNVVNQGRPTAKVEETILEYAARTEAGSAAPAPILRYTSAGMHVLDGVQRLCSEELLGATSFSAYVVTTDSERMARLIRVSANQLLAGNPPPAEWTRSQAIQLLIIEEGMSIEEVCHIFGWKADNIRQEKTYLEWMFKIRCIEGPQQLPKGIVLNIAKHTTLDTLEKAAKPIAAFCHDLKRGHFTNGDSEPYIDAFFSGPVRKKDSPHEHFSQRLEAFRADDEVAIRLDGRRPQQRTAEGKIVASLKTAKTIVEAAVKANARVPYVDECFQLVNQIEKGLRELKKAGGR